MLQTNNVYFVRQKIMEQARIAKDSSFSVNAYFKAVIKWN